MKQGILDNPKFMDFVFCVEEITNGALDGVGMTAETAALGMLEKLNHWTAKTPKIRDGGIGRSSDRVICRSMGWKGSPDLLMASLLDVGWIVQSPDPAVRYYIKSWSQHAEDWTNMGLAKDCRLFADGTFPKMARLSEPQRAEILLGYQAKGLDYVFVDERGQVTRYFMDGRKMSPRELMEWESREAERGPCAQMRTDAHIPKPKPIPFPDSRFNDSGLGSLDSREGGPLTAEVERSAPASPLQEYPDPWRGSAPPPPEPTPEPLPAPGPEPDPDPSDPWTLGPVAPSARPPDSNAGAFASVRDPVSDSVGFERKTQAGCVPDSGSAGGRGEEPTLPGNGKLRDRGRIPESVESFVIDLEDWGFCCDCADLIESPGHDGFLRRPGESERAEYVARYADLFAGWDREAWPSLLELIGWITSSDHPVAREVWGALRNFENAILPEQIPAGSKKKPFSRMEKAERMMLLERRSRTKPSRRGSGNLKNYRGGNARKS